MPRKALVQTRIFFGVEYFATVEVPPTVYAPNPQSRIVDVTPTTACPEKERQKMRAMWIGKTTATWRNPNVDF